VQSRTSRAFGTKAGIVVGAPRRMRFRSPAVAVVLVMSIVATACGARVGPYLGAGGGADVGGSNGANNGATAGAGATATTAPTSGPSSQTGTGSGGGGGGGGGGGNPTVAPATSFSYTPQAEAAACSGSAGNTASAPGVTASAIELGNVSGITGPLQGSFQQGAQAVNALFDAVNAAGGICGRKLDVASNSLDDQQNTSTNKADIDQLIAKPVFAFVGSTSDADGGGVQDMEAANIPDYGFAIDCHRSESTTYFSVDGGSCYQKTPGSGPFYIGDGAFALAQSAGYLPKKMAFLAYSIAISAQAAQQFAYVYQHSFGGSICYTDYSISPVSASLESDVAQMQSAGCQGVYTTLDVTGNAKLLQAMQQQNFSMPYTATTFDGYTPLQISSAGQSAAQGLDVTIPFLPLNESAPMENMYKQQLAQYVPGAAPGGFGFLDWLAGQMFIYNLLQAGRNPTRASLMAALNSLHNYDAGGAVGPYTPSSHGVNLCIMDTQVKGNDFVRRAPASGLFCNAQLVQASAS